MTKQDISTIVTELGTLASRLRQEADSASRQLGDKVVESYKPAAVQPQDKEADNMRVARLCGVAALAAGIVGAISTEDDTWPYIIGALGLGAFGLSYVKRDRQPAPPVKPAGISGPEANQKLLSETDRISDEWSRFTDDKKSEIQSLITSSDLPDAVKNKCFEHTYYAERLDVDMTGLFSTLSASGVGPVEIKLAISKWQRIVGEAIRKSENRQAAEWKAVADLL